MFLSERKAPLSIDGAQKLIERLGEAAGLPFPIHAHMLRHAAGYALAARGVDTRTLQAFMGHRSRTLLFTPLSLTSAFETFGASEWASSSSRCGVCVNRHSGSVELM